MKYSNEGSIFSLQTRGVLHFPEKFPCGCLVHGEEVASYWYGAREEDYWVNWPEHYTAPPGAMVLWDAFNVQGCTYHHLSFFAAIVGGWSEISLPLEQFRLVSITKAPRVMSQK